MKHTCEDTSLHGQCPKVNLSQEDLVCLIFERLTGHQKHKKIRIDDYIYLVCHTFIIRDVYNRTDTVRNILNLKLVFLEWFISGI